MKTTKPHKNYNNKVTECKLTHKVGFASESAVSKKVGGKYADIVRYYKCSSVEEGGCGLFHLTSQNVTETLNYNSITDCVEENRLLKLQNSELSAENKELGKRNKKITFLENRRKRQVDFLIDFIVEKQNLNLQQRVELKSIINRME